MKVRTMMARELTMIKARLHTQIITIAVTMAVSAVLMPPITRLIVLDIMIRFAP
jgi:hypothetical protein